MAYTYSPILLPFSVPLSYSFQLLGSILCSFPCSLDAVLKVHLKVTHSPTNTSLVDIDKATFLSETSLCKQHFDYSPHSSETHCSKSKGMSHSNWSKYICRQDKFTYRRLASVSAGVLHNLWASLSDSGQSSSPDCVRWITSYPGDFSRLLPTGAGPSPTERKLSWPSSPLLIHHNPVQCVVLCRSHSLYLLSTLWLIPLSMPSAPMVPSHCPHPS